MKYVAFESWRDAWCRICACAFASAAFDLKIPIIID
jgi:hypothetical protein